MKEKNLSLRLYIFFYKLFFLMESQKKIKYLSDENKNFINIEFHQKS